MLDHELPREVASQMPKSAFSKGDQEYEALLSDRKYDKERNDL